MPATATVTLPDELFYVWSEDDIDSSFFEDTDEPRQLYVCSLCIDCEPESADLIRGYDPRDGIFERPGRVVESVGGIDLPDPSDEVRIRQEIAEALRLGRDPQRQLCELEFHEYKREIQHELLVAFEARRESMIERGAN